MDGELAPKGRRHLNQNSEPKTPPLPSSHMDGELAPKERRHFKQIPNSLNPVLRHSSHMGGELAPKGRHVIARHGSAG
jgi:hypothetical protein